MTKTSQKASCLMKPSLPFRAPGRFHVSLGEGSLSGFVSKATEGHVKERPPKCCKQQEPALPDVVFFEGTFLGRNSKGYVQTTLFAGKPFWMLSGGAGERLSLRNSRKGPGNPGVQGPRIHGLNCFGLMTVTRGMCHKGPNELVSCNLPKTHVCACAAILF